MPAFRGLLILGALLTLSRATADVLTTPNPTLAPTTRAPSPHPTHSQAPTTQTPTQAPTIQASALNTFIGVAITLGGTVMAALANVLIKVAGNKNDELPEDKRKHPCCNPLWHIIIFLFLVGGIVNFVAFIYASISTLAPIASVAIAFNVALARCFLGETLTIKQYIGSALVLIGSGIAVRFGPGVKENKVNIDSIVDELLRPTYLYFLISKSFTLIFCCVIVYTKWGKRVIRRTAGVLSVADDQLSDLVEDNHDLNRVGSSDNINHEIRTRWHSTYMFAPPGEQWKVTVVALAYAFVVSIVGSWTNLWGSMGVKLVETSIKAAAGDPGETNQMKSWITWGIIAMMIVCAILQLKTTAGMMASFEAVYIVPIYYCIFIFQLVGSDAMFYQEFTPEFVTTGKVYPFCGSIVLCVLGIMLLSSQKEQAGAQEEEEAEGYIYEQMKD